MLWVDKRKECGTHLTISVVGVDPLRKRKLLSTFFGNDQILPGAFIGYLVLQSLPDRHCTLSVRYIVLASYIDVRDICTFIKPSGWSSSVGYSCFKCVALALTNH